MIPIFRSLISVPAGVERMRLPVFLALTTLGSAIWNTVFVLAATRWRQLVEVSTIASTYSKVILALAALALLVFVVMRLLRPGGGQRRRGRGRGDGPDIRPQADDDRPGTGARAGGRGRDGGVSEPDSPPAGTPGESAHRPAHRARARR